MGPTRDAVLAALRGIEDPGGGSLVDSGVLKALTVGDGAVRFVLDVPAEGAQAYGAVRDLAESTLRRLDGVTSVSIVLTAPAAPTRSAARPDRGAAPELRARKSPSAPTKVPGVDRIVAIASGKGGVGKSTVAANLACALAIEGRRVGMLDADVYGPSQPRMLGVSGRPASPDGKTILPMRNFGVTMMSIGLMVEEGKAVIWRGPMLMGALQQMLMQVQWGELDVLIVDLPPGTGDVQMTLAQKAEVTGSIIVSTPQDVALIDARKAIDMFRQLKVPIVGMIENMSTHICSNCGHEEHLFGHGGVAAEAEKLGLPLLAEIPLQLSIREASDAGAPVVVAAPDSPEAQAFRKLARALIDAGQA